MTDLKAMTLDALMNLITCKSSIATPAREEILRRFNELHDECLKLKHDL